jgi:hypothetical protein
MAYVILLMDTGRSRGRMEDALENLDADGVGSNTILQLLMSSCLVVALCIIVRTCMLVWNHISCFPIS